MPKEEKKLPIIIFLVLIIFLLGIITSLLLENQKTAKSKTESQEAETYQAESQTEGSQKTEAGFIEGSLGYPSEGIPSDMEICAQNLETKKMYYTTEHLKNSKYTYKIGYKLEAPEGNYYVFAITSSFGEPGYKAYYSSFVTCGMRDKCRSHNLVAVTVSEGEITNGIDPIDWYVY